MRNIIIMLLTLCFVLSVALANQARSETIAELKRMSEQGNLSAKHTLAAWYFKLSGKYGETPNETIGLSLFEEAAEAGFAESQYCLGLAYGDKDDFEKAVFWLGKAVNNGLKKAEEALKLYQEVYPRFLSNLKNGFIAHEDEEFIKGFKPECRITETINTDEDAKEKSHEYENLDKEAKSRLERIIKEGHISQDDYDYFEFDSFYKRLDEQTVFSDKRKEEIKELYRRAKKAKLRNVVILNGGPALRETFKSEKVVIWNKAAKTIYGVKWPYSYSAWEFGDNSLAAKELNRMLREQGSENGYSSEILFEIWDDLGTGILEIKVLP